VVFDPGWIDGAEYDDVSMFYPDELVRASAEAVHVTYRTKINELEAQLLLYRRALVENGIEPPEAPAGDLLELMRLIARMTEASTAFAHFFGSGREFWSGESWLAPAPAADLDQDEVDGAELGLVIATADHQDVPVVEQVEDEVPDDVVVLVRPDDAEL
jgi:hypothetical protein